LEVVQYRKDIGLHLPFKHRWILTGREEGELTLGRMGIEVWIATVRMVWQFFQTHWTTDLSDE
jgi:hypothetical protein